jgi:hypothetical protein
MVVEAMRLLRATEQPVEGFDPSAEPTAWSRGREQGSDNVTKCHTLGDDFAESSVKFYKKVLATQEESRRHHNQGLRLQN